MENKRVIIIGGGTFFDVRTHFSLAARAFGRTADQLADICLEELEHLDVALYTTMMAGNKAELYTQQNLEQGIGAVDIAHTPLITNADVAKFLERKIIPDDKTKIVFFTPAMCDWEMIVDGVTSGRDAARLSTHQEFEPDAQLYPADKVVNMIRKDRKDIFLIAFKQTHGATEDEQYIAGLHLCKSASANLVLANDTKTRVNMIVTPEEARHGVTTNRTQVLKELVKMAGHRSHLTFTRSTVVSGDPVPWSDNRVPVSLREVVNFCIKSGSYRAFRGVTAGHFAVKIDDQTFLTSIRKTDFNNLNQTGLVLVKTDGPDTVLAYGAKPSVGGQSQRIVFNDHEGMDCIVHFHCPMKSDARDEIPVASQREFECGSHECGQNTSSHLAQFGNLKAVYLDEHGPNIVFNRGIDPKEVISFIEANFDLSQKTGGYVSTSQGKNELLSK